MEHVVPREEVGVTPAELRCLADNIEGRTIDSEYRAAAKALRQAASEIERIDKRLQEVNRENHILLDREQKRKSTKTRDRELIESLREGLKLAEAVCEAVTPWRFTPFEDLPTSGEGPGTAAFIEAAHEAWRAGKGEGGQ